MAENQIGSTRTFRRTITAADGTEIIPILNAADSFANMRSYQLATLWGKVSI
jgi:hypothetical protein